MRFQRLTTSLMFAVVVSIGLIVDGAGQAANQPAKKGDKEAAEGQKTSENREKVTPAQEKLKLAQEFIAQIERFQNDQVRAMALAKMADVIWDVDKAFSRNLFLRAYEVTKSFQDGSDEEKRKESNSLKINIIKLVAARDRQLAQELTDNSIEGDSEQSKSQLDRKAARTKIEVAASLIQDQPKAASDLAEQSLQLDIQAAWLVSFLKQLRSKDQVAADTLYLKTLNKLREVRSVKAEDILHFGTYVFTSPKLPASAPSDAIAQVLVGKIMAIDVTGDRPEVSSVLKKQYLAAFADVLTRFIEAQEAFSNTRQQQYYYSASYLLVTKAEKYAPELLGHLQLAMQILSGVVPPEATKESYYSNINNPPLSFNERLKRAESYKNSISKDVEYLSLVWEQWEERNYEQARKVTDKINDAKTQRQLVTLIDFGEARDLLAKGNQTSALEMTKRLQGGAEQSILWLGIARDLSKKNNWDEFSSAIQNALSSARQVKDAKRPFLILNAALQLAGFDEDLAWNSLAEAIGDFNSLKSAEAAQVTWHRKVSVDMLSYQFPLDVAGVEFGFDKTLTDSHFLSKRDDVVSKASELIDEEQRSLALVAIARSLLKQTPKR